MRHEVEDDVDAEWIGDLFRELTEEQFVLALPFPAVADVAVVNGQDHHPLPVVEKCPDVNLLRSFPPIHSLESRPGIIRIMGGIPELHGRYLEVVHRKP
jgi:hypothetical protein